MTNYEKGQPVLITHAETPSGELAPLAAPIEATFVKEFNSRKLLVSCEDGTPMLVSAAALTVRSLEGEA